jgi:hypothetical protein
MRAGLIATPAGKLIGDPSGVYRPLAADSIGEVLAFFGRNLAPAGR